MKRWETWKRIASTLVLLLCLTGGLLLHALLPDLDISLAERRTFRQFPQPTWAQIYAGKWMRDFESYLLDQFPFRDTWRGAKAGMQLHLFRRLDNNGLYMQQGHLFKQDAVLDEASIANFANKVRTIYEMHLQNTHVYIAIIPDKSQYASPKRHLTLPYEDMVSMLWRDLPDGIQRIPLLDVLTLEAYYATDIHWRQERLAPVVQRLKEAMAFDADLSGTREKTYAPFYGGYFGQAAVRGVRPDTLYYLENDVLRAAIVEDLQHPDRKSVYYEEGLQGIDAYDVFLNGATPLVTLRNDKVENGKKLLLFRDSFGSSLAPLLLGAYEEITLVDLRYMSSDLLAQHIDFEGRDVLFLYGEAILNASYTLK